MIAQVDPTLQEETSHQLIALHLLILSDIADSEPSVNSHRIVYHYR